MSTRADRGTAFTGPGQGLACFPNSHISPNRKCRSAASRRDDHCYAPADNIPGQRYKSIGLTIRGAEINRHGPAFDVTPVFQALAKCSH
jgi:hypothetical protein